MNRILPGSWIGYEVVLWKMKLTINLLLQYMLNDLKKERSAWRVISIGHKHCWEHSKTTFLDAGESGIMKSFLVYALSLKLDSYYSRLPARRAVVFVKCQWLRVNSVELRCISCHDCASTNLCCSCSTSRWILCIPECARRSSVDTPSSGRSPSPTLQSLSS